jgi:triacylglycerol esterase/lipase EstA (alpha/beta hydrolase family)
MIVREVGASMKLIFYYHPFEAILNTHDATAPIAKNQEAPVLFVHGFYANAGFWLQFKRYLKSKGMGALYTMNLDPPIHDIEAYVGQLAQRITKVCAHSSRQKIVLVAHSMGGLVCRAYLARYGGTHIAQLITIGCPHHGTILARLLPGHNMKQMHPGNPWLKELNAKQKASALSTYFSLHDNIVVPQDSACLAGAREVVFNGLGHLSMAFSPAVQRTVLDDIKT